METPDRSDAAGKLPALFSARRRPPSEATPLWQESFSSRSLQKDIARLNKSNFQLAAARARVDRATAAYGISRAGLRPDVDVTAETGRTLTREDGDSDRETSIPPAL